MHTSKTDTHTHTQTRPHTLIAIYVQTAPHMHLPHARPTSTPPPEEQSSKKLVLLGLDILIMLWHGYANDYKAVKHSSSHQYFINWRSLMNPQR